MLRSTLFCQVHFDMRRVRTAFRIWLCVFWDRDPGMWEVWDKEIWQTILALNDRDVFIISGRESPNNFTSAAVWLLHINVWSCASTARFIAQVQQILGIYSIQSTSRDLRRERICLSYLGCTFHIGHASSSRTSEGIRIGISLLYGPHYASETTKIVITSCGNCALLIGPHLLTFIFHGK